MTSLIPISVSSLGRDNPSGSTQEATFLPDLAAAIRQEYDASQTAARSVITHAINIGQLLLKAKNAREFKCTGGFSNWVKRHCQISLREAQRYMRLAKYRSILEKVDATHVSFFSLRGALQRISEELKRQAAGTAREKSSDTTEVDRVSEEPSDPAAIAHIERCQIIKALIAKGEGQKAVDVDLLTRVGQETRTFVQEVVALARKHGHRLSQARFAGADYDAETIAMLMLKLAENKLNPYAAFAPRRQKGCGDRPSHPHSESSRFVQFLQRRQHLVPAEPSAPRKVCSHA